MGGTGKFFREIDGQEFMLLHAPLKVVPRVLAGHKQMLDMFDYIRVVERRIGLVSQIFPSPPAANKRKASALEKAVMAGMKCMPGMVPGNAEAEEKPVKMKMPLPDGGDVFDVIFDMALAG